MAFTHSSLPPWKWKCANIQFSNVLDGCTGKHDSAENIHAAVDKLLLEIRDTDLVAYTDGSVGENNTGGGAGAVIAWPNGESTTSKKACGKICSSYKAEMSALNMKSWTTLKQ